MQAGVNNNVAEQQYKNPGWGKTIGGVMAGSAVSGTIGSLKSVPSGACVSRMIKINNKFTPDEVKLIKKAANDALKSTGLAEKGVKIIRPDSVQNTRRMYGTLMKEFGESAKYLPKSWQKPAKKILSTILGGIVESGGNAAYLPKQNKIILPAEKLQGATFHEIGHALNANNGGFTKMLQKGRFALLALPVIGMIAMWKTKKAQDEKPKGIIDKTTNFIKENAGKLAFAAFIPLLAEEGLASIRGAKIAKELLPANLLKTVKRTHALGFTSYLAGAVLTSVGLYAGVKIKDSIAHRKPVENNPIITTAA